MLNPDSPLGRLFAAPARPGRVTWIGLRPERRAPMLAVGTVLLDPATGLAGDRYGSPGGARQVTLLQAEHLAAIASYLGRAALPPELLRRNILVEGINLLALKGQTLWLGEALLQVTGECHPCSRMEAALGTGGYNAMRGHGGITARVLQPGRLNLGDALRRGEAPGGTAPLPLFA